MRRPAILDSVLMWTAETGLRKLSMGDVAKRARIVRATLYKHFPRRELLIDAFVQSELAKFFDQVESVVEQHDTPEDRLVYGFAHAYRLLRSHPAVKTVLVVNPELIVPYTITRVSYANVIVTCVLSAYSARCVHRERMTRSGSAGGTSSPELANSRTATSNAPGI
ncbi:TetR family transcriptional regulator [Mycobacteroides chelonae]|uniref:TetR family transcriptional regulator n=1 Tax=Mycobacteroides chelonae TaxID=1774 RepID=UPI0009BEBD6E